MISAIKRDERLYILAAFSLFLAVIEYMIPKPLPFLRIGLANLPILLALGIFSPRDILLLTLYKVIGQGLVQGTLFSYVFLFSAAGSFAGSLVMLAAHGLFRRGMSLVGVSVLGAFAGNLVRLLLAYLFLFGEQARIIAPPFLAVGLVASVFLGWFAREFLSRSSWLKDGRPEAP